MVKKEIVLPEEYNYIAAFLTMRCNLNCSFCLNALDKSVEFDRKKYKEISGEKWAEGLNRIVSRPEVPITLCGGEPGIHKDFIQIINNVKPELNMDILTNLYWNDQAIDQFVSQVNPERLKRNSPYASIRVSYHPEQMDAEKLVRNTRKLLDAGFSVGIWSVLYPSPEQLSAINQMQFRCKDSGIEFRLKEFTGEYLGKTYGDYSKYPDSTFRDLPRKCLCKTSELILGPNGNVYKCHRDLFAEEFPIGNLLDDPLSIEPRYRECSKYGKCHPCDVKVKTDYKQELGHTSVEIKPWK